MNEIRIRPCESASTEVNASVTDLIDITGSRVAHCYKKLQQTVDDSWDLLRFSLSAT